MPNPHFNGRPLLQALQYADKAIAHCLRDPDVTPAFSEPWSDIQKDVEALRKKLNAQIVQDEIANIIKKP